MLSSVQYGSLFNSIRSIPHCIFHQSHLTTHRYSTCAAGCIAIDLLIAPLHCWVICAKSRTKSTSEMRDFNPLNDLTNLGQFIIRENALCHSDGMHIGPEKTLNASGCHRQTPIGIAIDWCATNRRIVPRPNEAKLIAGNTLNWLLSQSTYESTLSAFGRAANFWTVIHSNILIFFPFVILEIMLNGLRWCDIDGWWISEWFVCESVNRQNACCLWRWGKAHVISHRVKTRYLAGNFLRF